MTFISENFCAGAYDTMGGMDSAKFDAYSGPMAGDRKTEDGWCREEITKWSRYSPVISGTF
ncbi:MAG: hypothetical protein RIG62_29640 [Cyclobacteriaceae bacterium]